MVQKIAFFNHKGGVSKTTITFNLGWILALKSKTVILVDTDPQCNLTRMALGEGTEASETRIKAIYDAGSNIKTGLAPAFESQPRAIKAVDCISLGEQQDLPGRLLLLPGHVGFAEYEVTLGIAQELGGSIQSLKNLPGAISDLLAKTASKYDADYILIDMSPSLGSINQNVLTTSDFFIIPTTADFFSVMATDSLSKVLPKWYAWAKQASSLHILQEAVYPFPQTTMRFLGTIIIQNHQIRNGTATPTFQTWIDDIERDVTNKLISALRKSYMLLPMQDYTDSDVDDSLTLAEISNFNSLIGLSQKYQTPIFSLTETQLRSKNQQGVVLDDAARKREEFHTTFDTLAKRIIKLTSMDHAVSASTV